MQGGGGKLAAALYRITPNAAMGQNDLPTSEGGLEEAILQE